MAKENGQQGKPRRITSSAEFQKAMDELPAGTVVEIATAIHEAADRMPELVRTRPSEDDIRAQLVERGLTLVGQGILNARYEEPAGEEQAGRHTYIRGDYLSLGLDEGHMVLIRPTVSYLVADAVPIAPQIDASIAEVLMGSKLVDVGWEEKLTVSFLKGDIPLVVGAQTGIITLHSLPYEIGPIARPKHQEPQDK